MENTPCKEPRKAIILIKEEEDNIAHPIFFGTETQCKGIMFDVLVPSGRYRNLVNKDADWGYWISYERMKQGTWSKVEMILQILPEEGIKDPGLVDWFTL